MDLVIVADVADVLLLLLLLFLLLFVVGIIIIIIHPSKIWKVIYIIQSPSGVSTEKTCAPREVGKGGASGGRGTGGENRTGGGTCSLR